MAVLIQTGGGFHLKCKAVSEWLLWDQRNSSTVWEICFFLRVWWEGKCHFHVCVLESQEAITLAQHKPVSLQSSKICPGRRKCRPVLQLSLVLYHGTVSFKTTVLTTTCKVQYIVYSYFIFILCYFCQSYFTYFMVASVSYLIISFAINVRVARCLIFVPSVSHLLYYYFWLIWTGL